MHTQWVHVTDLDDIDGKYSPITCRFDNLAATTVGRLAAFLGIEAEPLTARSGAFLSEPACDRPKSASYDHCSISPPPGRQCFR